MRRMGGVVRLRSGLQEVLVLETVPRIRMVQSIDSRSRSIQKVCELSQRLVINW